ncbi:hypothetical protein J437_LFUL012639 [Ladona fulva]|uniref:Uncharacterized protein n=1 Tax=Ladona fulva TaxID=123851 RepID=A0A8K0KDP8_LADFU|nr:hypothetical protein J437_LFUL012639 [Ladona fulva]
MFLPSILGAVGKLLGKGVSSLGAASAGASSHGGAIDDFDFKDNHHYDDHGTALSPYSAASSTSSNTLQAAASSGVGSVTYPQNRVETIFGMQEPYYVSGTNGGTVLQRLPAYTTTGGGIYLAAPSAQGTRYTSGTGGTKYKLASVTSTGPTSYGNKFSYVTKNGKNDDRLNAVSDFKVFHNIPSSALLLTTYDPFYSPLLSRVDSVFKQLGRQTEGCRERLVCDLYRNPAKFAPFSNLVSAQLSRPKVET